MHPNIESVNNIKLKSETINISHLSSYNPLFQPKFGANSTSPTNQQSAIAIFAAFLVNLVL